MKRFLVMPPILRYMLEFNTLVDAEEYAENWDPDARIIDRGHGLHKIESENAEKPAADPKPANLLCFIEQFPLAMQAVAAVHDYDRGPLVKGDYRPSLLRHLFGIGEHPDPDAAIAWNALAQLEITLRLGRDK